MKTKESLDQNNRNKALEYDLQKTLVRCSEIEKTVEARSYDIRNKSVQLGDNEKEISRVKDLNG